MDYLLQLYLFAVYLNTYCGVWQASEATLTVYDKPTLRQLNASTLSCGGASWQYAVPQVVTNTSGCPAIGVVVVDFETDVVRVDERHHWPLLYLGHTDSDVTRFISMIRTLCPQLSTCWLSVNVCVLAVESSTFVQIESLYAISY